MKVSLHHQLVDSIDARCSRTTGRQRDARRFGEPSSVGNQSQESIELTFFVLRRPRRQLALHFTDYQRSSPHCGQLIRQASHSNCPPSPCGRLSRPRTTTGAPSTCTASGTHSLGICASLPQFTCWTQHTGEVAYRSLYALLSASRRGRHGLATRSPWLHTGRRTYPFSIRAPFPTC